MAGICGSVSGHIDSILDKIKHRGTKIDVENIGDAWFGCSHLTGRKQIIKHKEKILVYDGAFYGIDETDVMDKLAEDPKSVGEIDGDFALAFYDGEHLILSTDIVGTKPLWVNNDSFASERKALKGAVPVKPGTILQDFKPSWRFGFEKGNPNKKDHTLLKDLIIRAVDKRTKDIKKAALLFSGGVDSTLLALLLSDRIKLTCYTAGFSGAPDITWAEKVAEEMGLKLNIVEMEATEGLVKNVVDTIDTTNVMKVGVAMPVYVCCRGCEENVMFSGVGSEEIFAGYERHIKALEEGWAGMQKEMWKGIETMWERDLQRDDLAASAFSIELRAPFVDRYVIEEAMKIHPSLKYNGKMKKVVLRKIAKELGVPEEVCKRPKKAAQYGSYSHKIIVKLAKRHGMKAHDYLRSLASQ
ncbi:MAG: asparagine synthetase B [Candidatus Diapherotrites archaeon]|nr:asparagine synthetase B [Candidatus Diapherotrites archaeon]